MMAIEVQRQTIIVSANSTWNITNFRRPLIAALRREGYRVVIAAPDGQVEEQFRQEIQSHEPLHIESDGLNPLADAQLLLSYFRLFRRVRAIAYLSFTAKPNIYGAFAARLLGIPAIPNVSGLGTAFIRGGALQKLVSFLYRRAFRGAPVVFFQNGEDRDLFIEHKIVRTEQARVLPGSGINLQHFKPVPVARRNEDYVFLFIGRLLGDKGVREFVEAARQVKLAYPQSRFQLLGSASAANRTAISPRELAAWKAEGVIEYLGAADDVRPYIAHADAVVLPSYREGLPRSLLEAGAMARPLIATDVPGNRELVQNGENGLLCVVRSPESLAEAFDHFIRMPAAEKARMGQESRRVVEERFSEEKVVAAYLEALRQLADSQHTKVGA